MSDEPEKIQVATAVTGTALIGYGVAAILTGGAAIPAIAAGGLLIGLTGLLGKKK